MNIKALALRAVKALPTILTIVSVIVAVVTISFRDSSTDNTKQRTAWGSVIAISAGAQILLAIIGAFWFADPIATANRSLWGMVLMTGAAAFAIVYAAFLMSNRDGVALGAAVLTVTIADALSRAARLTL